MVLLGFPTAAWAGPNGSVGLALADTSSSVVHTRYPRLLADRGVETLSVLSRVW